MRDERTRPSRMVPLKADSSSRTRFCCTASNSCMLSLQYALRSCSVTSTPVGQQKKSLGKGSACIWVRSRNSDVLNLSDMARSVRDRASVAAWCVCVCVCVCVCAMNVMLISVSCARRVNAKSPWLAKAFSDQGSRQGTNEKASQMKGQRWQQQDKPPSQWVQHSPTEVEIHSRGAFRLCEVLMGGV